MKFFDLELKDMLLSNYPKGSGLAYIHDGVNIPCKSEWVPMDVSGNPCADRTPPPPPPSKLKHAGS